jgi:hypothetical protein
MTNILIHTKLLTTSKQISEEAQRCKRECKGRAGIHFDSIDIYLFGVIRVYRIFKNLKTAAASVARRTIFFQSMH